MMFLSAIVTACLKNLPGWFRQQVSYKAFVPSIKIVSLLPLHSGLLLRWSFAQKLIIKIAIGAAGYGKFHKPKDDLQCRCHSIEPLMESSTVEFICDKTSPWKYPARYYPWCLKRYQILRSIYRRSIGIAFHTHQNLQLRL